MILRVENTARTGREAEVYYLGWAEVDGAVVPVMWTEAEMRHAAERAASNAEDVPAPPADVAALQAAILQQAPAFDVQSAEGVYRVTVVPQPDGALGLDCEEVTP